MSKRIKNFIGPRLKEALEYYEITPKKLSDEIKINQSLIYDYLNERKAPTEKNLELISKYFNLPTEFFTNKIFFYDGIEMFYIEDFFNKLFLKEKNQNEETITLRTLNTRNFDYFDTQIRMLFRSTDAAGKYEINDLLSNFNNQLLLYISGIKKDDPNYKVGSNDDNIITIINLIFNQSRYTMKEISEKCGINITMLYDLRAGRYKPSKKILDRLVSGLDLPENIFDIDFVINGNILFFDAKSEAKDIQHITELNNDKTYLNRLNKIFESRLKIITFIYKKLNEKEKRKVNQSLKKLLEKAEIEIKRYHNQIKEEHDK